MLRWIFFFWAIFSVTYAFQGFDSHKNATKLPPCEACKTFVQSFYKGLHRTSKFRFEGGDTAWEEKKLGSYATSEIRFVEIQEKVCSEVVEGKQQCYDLLEEHDDKLEDWWFHLQTKKPDLFGHICIDTSKVCCPDLHYGTDCQPCPAYLDIICNDHGKCNGDGTRKGDGKCICNQGYGGDNCDECADGYYVSYKDDTKFMCSECHIACEYTCTKAGPEGCDRCKMGWMKDMKKGCYDVNECAAVKSPCSPLQFCVNKEGGFRCLDCDKSCAGCNGDGPDMCVNCASGYYMRDNVCIDSAEESRQNFIYISRYLTYMGLCIATCIILHKNTYVAAIVGSCVAIYITVSEYMLNTVPTPKTDLENQVAEQVLKAFN